MNPGINPELKEKLDRLLSVEQKAKILPINPLKSFSDGYVSSTMLESFFACPYFNYAQNLLKLKETENGEMRANETGTMLHLLTELFVKNLNEVKDNESSDALVEKLTAEILSSEEYSRYLNNPMYNFTFSQLKKEGKRVCFAIFTAIQKVFLKI